MGYTPEQIEQIARLISSGVKSVELANESITYQDLEDLRALLADMTRTTGTTTAQTYRLAAVSKGFP
jgi:hypothetical protein